MQQVAPSDRQVVTAAFALPVPTADQRALDSVKLMNGNYAILAVDNVVDGASAGSANQQSGQRRLMSVEQAEQMLPKSKTVWLEDSIHDVPLQRPELVADVLKSHMVNGFFG